MKKTFIAAFLLPFSLFAAFDYNGYTIKRSKVFYYTGYDTTLSSSKAELYVPLSESDLFPIYFNNTFGFKISLSSTNTGRSPSVPSTSILFTNNVSSTFASIAFPFNGSKDSVNYGISPFFFPSLSSLYFAAASLFENGYRGSGVTYFSSGYDYCVNVNFTELIPDVLSSTNSIYRQILLNNLASITSSLSSIDLKLTDIYNSLSSGSSSFTYSNIVSSAEGLQAFAANNGFNLDLQKIESDVNPSNWDLNDPEGRLAYQAALDSYGKGLQQLSDLVGMASALNSSNGVDNRYNGLQQLGNAFNGSVDASVNDFKRLSTNWQEGVKKDLQDWRNDVTNRLAHMFDDNIPIDGGNSMPVYVSGQNGGPVSVAGVVRIDQQIPVGVTISAPITIDPTQFNQFSSGWESIIEAVKDFHDYFTSWASNGDIGFGWVRYYSMMYDFSQNTLTNQLAQISLLSSLTNLFANYADNFTNNVIFSISNALAGLSSVSNDYMLLSDYAHYINSHGLVDLIDIMDDDTYSALKDELFGISSLDQADSYGRWWRYFTGLETINANSNYKLANLFIGHENTLKDLKDSSGADSLIDKFQQLFELIPSPTDIMDKTGNMTNSIDRSGFASLVDQSSSMSNYFNRVEMFFNRGSSLPANISINLGFGNKPGLNNAQPIVLPLDKYRGVMDLLHYGIAFSYCIVNLILLPKFLLILIHLFDRVWKGYDKKLSDAVQA